MSGMRKLFNRQALSVRVFFLMLATCLFVFSLMAAAKAASTVGLKPDSIVTGTTITLGDIFYNLPRDADKVLGPAPHPGADMTLDARTLLRIAIALDLPWRPASVADSITLSSAATIIDDQLVREAVKSALREKGVENSFNLLFAGEQPQIILPQDQPGTVEIININYDPQREWFDATLAAPSAENPVQRLKVSGAVERMVEIPVLRDSLRAGDIIGERDISFLEMRAKDITPEIAMRAEDIKGTTPRRTVMAGKPIKMQDIEEPRIVERGDTVTMIFQDGPLTLTATGRALENGTKGDLIRVVNANSNKTVEGVVSAEREITVQAY